MGEPPTLLRGWEAGLDDKPLPSRGGLCLLPHPRRTRDRAEEGDDPVAECGREEGEDYTGPGHRASPAARHSPHRLAPGRRVGANTAPARRPAARGAGSGGRRAPWNPPPPARRLWRLRRRELPPRPPPGPPPARQRAQSGALSSARAGGPSAQLPEPAAGPAEAARQWDAGGRGERRCPGRARTAGALRAAPMWQEAMRRRRYLRDRAEEAAGGGDGLPRSRDWLYESYYCMSQQHPLIVFLLLIVMGACLALLAVFFALGLEVEDHVAFLITVPTALAIFFAIFILVCIESVFKKLLRLFSLVIWICLVAMGYLFMCFGGTVSPWDQVSFFLFIIFVVYTMLPFNMRDAIIASVLTSSSHTIVLSVCLSATPGTKEHLVWQILANVIIFICGNLAGAYHKHLMELALQQTYQDTCNCIKSRIKLEFEKRQQ
ncbi:adenylate cyclase type 2-like, partial [Cebus imitator]|uniref:adenylate cyclase type 2-like n=1 Tax=Cebus imitator TaxID=2715852 RepID=UPI00189776F7